MASLEGWRALGGSAQRYINPEGETVSRRAYLNARAQEAGWKNYSEFQRMAEKPLYKKFLAEAQAKDKHARRLESEFNRRWARMEKTGGPRKSRAWLPLLKDLGLEGKELWRKYARPQGK